MKRLTSFFLALTLLLTPMSALAFDDINDEETRVAANTLAALGIVSGYGDGQYHPNDYLNRAAFSKIAVIAMGAEDKLSTSKNLTIFADVLSSHWGAPYINVASRDLKIIQGFPDGTFRPEEPITNAQAITIVLSILGYTPTDVGLYWPRDQITKAEELGLIESTNIDANAYMTRGEAAVLLGKMLVSETKEGKIFITGSSFGTLAENVVITATSNTDRSIPEGYITYVSGSTSATVSTQIDIDNSYVGQTVSLLKDSSSRITGIIPNAEQYIDTFVVKSTALEGITDTSGNFYPIRPSTPTIVGAKLYVYSSDFINVKAGATVNLISDENDNLLYVQTSVSAATHGSHVLNDGYTSTNNPLLDFYSTQIASSATIIKDGIVVDATALRKGDVVTLSSDEKTISVSGAKLTGVLIAATPSYAYADNITVQGHSFALSSGYTPNLTQYQDKVVTVSVAFDGTVANIATADGGDTVLGVVESVATGTAKLKLESGFDITVEHNYIDSMAAELVGKLVEVTINPSGKAGLVAVTLQPSQGTINLNSMTYGVQKISPLVTIYERISEHGDMRQIEIEDIRTLDGIIDGTKVLHTEKNNSGHIVTMVLDNATGDMYKYGVITRVDDEQYSVKYVNESGTTVTTSGSTTSKSDITTAVVSVRTGGYAGLYFAPTGEIRGFAALTSIGEARVSSFDDDLVSVGGLTVEIAENTHVYDESRKSFITIDEALKNFTAFEVYVDKTVDTGGIVRLIVVGM